MSTVSIVTQTSVRPESAEAFARWQGETSIAISAFPGFLEQQLIPTAGIYDSGVIPLESRM